MRDLRQMEVLKQDGPACGTTILAMVIRFLARDNSISPEAIDKEIRRLPGMFSAPTDLVAYARRKGLRAEEYNHNSLQQVKELVGLGIPVLPLLDATPSNALDFRQWHWVVVLAVKQDDGNEKLVINNPWGQQEEWETDAFAEQWAHLRLLGLTFGYSNYFIAVGTADDDLPPRRGMGVGPANAVTKGLADVLNGFARVRADRSPKGLGQMLGGVFRLIYGAAYLVGSNIRSWIGLGRKHQTGQEGAT